MKKCIFLYSRIYTIFKNPPGRKNKIKNKKMYTCKNFMASNLNGNKPFKNRFLHCFLCPFREKE
jgi:hypothetical protein